MLYLFPVNSDDGAPTNAQVAEHIALWPGFSPNGLGFADGDRKGFRNFFPAAPATGYRGTMLLKRGFEVVKTEIALDNFKSEIDAVLASN